MKVNKVKLGTLFSVDGRLYAITKPTTASQTVNEHGQVVFTFYEMKG